MGVQAESSTNLMTSRTILVYNQGSNPIFLH